MIVDTLPRWLNFQASNKPANVAIRHKQLGVWGEKRWSELHSELLQVVLLLEEKGFKRGDTLFLLSYPGPEALLLSIAAQWLGGVSAPLDPTYEDAKVIALLNALQPSFVFAESQAQVDILLKAKLTHQLVIYADARGLSSDKKSYQHLALHQYSDIHAKANITRQIDSLKYISIAEPDDEAFVFYRLDESGQVEFQKLTHDEMLNHGRQLIKQESLTEQEEALAARAFAASGHVRYLLAPWLIAGFKLNFPENIHTRDVDRRESGPTLVAGTSATYQRLEALVQSRLPLPNTLHRKFLDWSLETTTQSFFIRRAIAYWLIARPLRDVIGLSRTRVPLLVGEGLPASSIAFFASIGVQVRNWPDVSEWYKSDAELDKPKRLSDLNRESSEHTKSLKGASLVGVAA